MPFIVNNYIIYGSQLVLGRGELKTRILALLAVGFLVIIPFISAQENLGVEPDEQVYLDEQVEEDPLRAFELSLTFADEATVLSPGAGPSIWNVIQMILVLALCAAAIYGVVYIFKRASKQTPNTDPFLKVLAYTHLGSNRYVHVVAIGTKAWLVGSSEGGVNLISEVEDQVIVDSMLQEEARKGTQTPGRLPDFLSVLRRFGNQTQANTPGADEIRKRRERLKGL